MEKIDPIIDAAGNQTASPASQQHHFEFTGNGSEFFRIWIVNILLTIVTLGVYSAWAKVRTKRYFYGNTHLAQSTFDYLADPVTILKGRLIAVAILLVYAAVRTINPIVEPLFFLFLFLLTPWLIVRSHAFNAINSSYRNIRFNFTGTTGEAAKEYIAYPLLILLTLGLIIPYIRYRQTRFTVDNHRFGDQYFDFNARVKSYFKVFGIAFVFMFVIGVFSAIMIAAVAGYSAAEAGASMDSQSQQQIAASMMVYIPIIYLFMAIIGIYVYVALLNLMFNGISIADNQFKSSLKVRSMLWIQLTNLLGLIITLGLFYPWAKVRLAKYRLEQLSVMATDLDSFTSSQADQVSATGDEIGEVFAVDMGF